MITPTEITQHIKTYLPIHTDKFTEYVTDLALVYTQPSILTVKTNTPHGLVAGDKVVLSGGKLANDITTVSIVDGQAVFTTKYDHDLIMPSQVNDDQTLELRGTLPAVWQGTHDIKGVPNRRNFIIDLPTGETLAPTYYGDLLENRNDWWGVQTISSADSVNFVISFSDLASFPIGAVEGIEIVKGFRISACSNFERAKAVYSKQVTDEAYLFVIMADGDVSKDRHTFNESIGGFTNQDMHLLRMIRNFSTTVFIPTGDDLSGSDAHDEAYGSLYLALLKTLFGFANTSEVIKYTAVPAGDGPAEYNSAYYAHVYDWQMPEVVTFEDGFLNYGDVAFRDIEQAFKMFNYHETDAEMSSDINLDEEPL